MLSVVFQDPSEAAVELKGGVEFDIKQKKLSVLYAITDRQISMRLFRAYPR